ncbi:MAG: hypothetical protein ABSD20_02750 [Terriglobales bacterium]
MRSQLFRKSIATAAMMVLSVLSLAQNQQERTLTVNGRTGKASVLQSNGQSYISFENLAQISGGSVSFQGNQIILTLPGTGANAAAVPGPASGSGDRPDALSRDFMSAGVESISMMREWRSSLASAVQNSFSVAGTWVSDQSGRARAANRQAAVAASTPADQNAAQLLRNEFDNLQAWSDKVVSERQNLDAELAVTAKTIKDDPQFQKIVTCSRFLGGMLVSGAFQDDPSCH